MRRLLLTAALALLAQPALGAVYTYKDAQGVVHFTNTMVPGAKEYRSGGEDDLGFGGNPGGKFANTPRMWTAPAMHKSARYDALILKAAQRYELPPALVKAVVAAESGFNPQARSSVGACGLMQLMPKTAAEMNVEDIYDPHENVMGGARYLRYLINAFSGDVKLAVAAYNAGPNLVARVKRVPDIPETRTYVKRVLRLYRSYRQSDVLAINR